ncbi:MAG: dTMP kinase [Actinobacteria bacterium]|nr:dTMP kinase [Actinomycetota bacterium]
MGDRGIFITFEGGEGCGKSTQIRRLAGILREAGYTVLLVREPGGTVIGEEIRAILLSTKNAALSAKAELLLYEAARAQIIEEVIAPALARGEVVLCDRFYDSTIAYQGYGRFLPLDIIDTLNSFAMGGYHPDRTILLELTSAIGLRRATVENSDRLEQAGAAFHERVHAGFAEIARSNPERVRVVHTQEQPWATSLAILDELDDLFPHIDRDHVEAALAADSRAYLEVLK